MGRTESHRAGNEWSPSGSFHLNPHPEGGGSRCGGSKSPQQSRQGRDLLFTKPGLLSPGHRSPGQPARQAGETEGCGGRLWGSHALKIDQVRLPLTYSFANWIWSLLVCESLGTREVTQCTLSMGGGV
jgi:hypothetical protein